MFNASLRRATALVVGGALIVLSATPAYAHERRTVGAYQFTVGWGDEPAYNGYKNSVQLLLSDAAGVRLAARARSDLDASLRRRMASSTPSRS